MGSTMIIIKKFFQTDLITDWQKMALYALNKSLIGIV